MIKENYIYVGIDLHKETHTAVMIDCYNQKLGEITFPNRPADFGCTLTTIPGVNVITAVKILAEIGDIKRFSNANKLAQFAGIAPLHLSSSGKGKDLATKQGNRRLQATIYFLAIQMVQISSKGTPRNPVVRAYYEKRKAEGKTSQQALICISRRLISIIYGMLKSGTEYRMPVMENTGETV